LRPSSAAPELGQFRLLGNRQLVAGSQADLRLEYVVGSAGLSAGSRFRVGLPNTGWDRPVVPQQRYWDEIVTGASRRLAPFHPVNTTATISSGAKFLLETMERMLIPDEDPAIAYWRWWITLRVEEQPLSAGDRIEILYGDRSFGVNTRIQTFEEAGINVTAFLQPAGEGPFLELAGSPFYIDVVAGEACRVNVVVPSVHCSPSVTARVAVTDECQCVPASGVEHTLTLQYQTFICTAGHASEVAIDPRAANTVSSASGAAWGRANPSVQAAPDGLQLYWGDLHGQSEHHVMHSQKMDFRQTGWSKGISCGTLDECYRYARDVSMLDFVAITDQGACLTDQWEFCQHKVREYHVPGRFVTLKGYEAGSPLGHRNVIYSTDEIDKPLDAKRFNSFHPDVVFEHNRRRGDVIIIPHHVKTWTDWQYHDPELEPLMEIYSCWGQSESPGLDLWNKGQTPGAGAWEAFRRGYRMGMIASSDNHVGMPGRSYPGDRQIHTPFPGGLCAVWAKDLSRDSLFASLRSRHCYGTTGARIIVRFSVGDAPMGSVVVGGTQASPMRVEVHGSAPIDRVEVVRNLETWRILDGDGGTRLVEEFACETAQPSVYYLRVRQTDGERAWTSPIWLE
jgi:hypothetical protein